MQKHVIHQNIERKMQCISGTLGMKERKEKNIFVSLSCESWKNTKMTEFERFFFFRSKSIFLNLGFLFIEDRHKNYVHFKTLKLLFFVVFSLDWILFSKNKKNKFPSFHSKPPGKLKHIIHRRKKNQKRYS